MGLYGNDTESSNRVALLPLLSLLVGAGMWGVVWYPMRLLEQGGFQGLWLTFVLYATALLVSLPRTATTLAAPCRQHLLGMTVLALAAGWTNVAFVLAILDGNILRVMLLFYLSPLWAVVMAWIVLRERPSRLALISLAVAMGGAAIMLWNPQMGAPWPRDTADWYALSAGFAFAVSNVAVRKLSGVSIAPKSAVVWVGVVLVAGALIAWQGLSPPQVSTALWLGALALGVFGILVMTVLVQYGVTHMPVHRSAVIMLFELLAGAVSQQLLTQEAMRPLEWVGGALIVAAAYISARH